MVDTAIVCDAVTLSYSEPRDHLLVISSDEDIVPGLIAASARGMSVILMNRTGKSEVEGQLERREVAIHSWSS